MNDAPEPPDVDEELHAIMEQTGPAIQQGRYRDAFEGYGQLRRRAKQANRVVHYIYGVFHQMDGAQYLFDIATMRDRALELIALLESEERARLIEPELPQGHYEYLRSWMTACAYENLAEATGVLKGYNSEGMHACIADGLQVCRRTGKLQCINCFREYAADVYQAADDLPMAEHQCRIALERHADFPERGDRRWLAASKLGWMHLLRGDLAAAKSWLDQAWEYTDSDEVNLQREAKYRVYPSMALTAHFLGETPPAAATAFCEDRPAREQWPSLAWDYDLLETALQLDGGEIEKAVETLQGWERTLRERQCLHHWFETALQLVAAHRLAGRDEQVAAWSKRIEQKARPAGDWLTLRRLERLLDPALPPSPIAALATPSGGTRPAVAGPGSGVETAADPKSSGADELDSPWEPRLEEFAQRLDVAYREEQDEEIARLRDELLAVGPDEVADPRDAGRLIYFVSFLLFGVEPDRLAGIWSWANRLAAPHDRDGTVINVLAHLGDVLRHGPDEALAERIPAERVEELFRQSLKLESSRANNYLRAGDYFLRQENLGEAEWCFARGFRLDRTHADLARRLAEVYQKEDRPSDALHALDLCLREGGADPAVAWEAGIAAFDLGRFEAQLTYLDRFEELVADQPWTALYRAASEFELGRVDDASSSLRAAVDRGIEADFVVDLLRAPIQLAAGDRDAGCAALRRVLDQPLRSVEDLTLKGLVSFFERVWRVVVEYLADDPLREELEDRLLAAGLAPEALFDRAAPQEAEPVEVQLFRCLVEQPLDARWPESPGVLAGQEEWTQYFIEYGVLAPDEAEAQRLALAWQSRCYPLRATVVETITEGRFVDRSRVVWQGFRFGGVPTDLEGDDVGEN